jgi:putative acetyltransferase
MKIEIMNEADENSVYQLMHFAFVSEGKTIENLLRDLFVHPAGKSGCGIVARDEKKVVGFVMLSIGLLDTFEENVKVGILGPLAVHPDFQKQGIGQSLIERLLAEAKQLHLPIVFLEGDPAYYSKMGFEPAKKFGMRKPSIRIPDAAFQCILLDGYEPWMQGTEVYPEPFWTNDCVGLRDSGFIAWIKQEVSEGREL